MMLRTRCFGSPCRLTVLYDGMKQIRNIGDSIFDDSDGEFRAFSSGSGNNIFLEIRQIKGNAPTGQKTTVQVNFTMEIYNTGCFYWNETEDTWSSDGCKVRGLCIAT